ncbi:hypothetical protein [Corynebacterium sp. A21]|uniref:hypothetical protein n=1 Tax=Corynebacterium sp. A21 TaxID=3457318 RepID=UPI003FD0E71D
MTGTTTSDVIRPAARYFASFDKAPNVPGKETPDGTHTLIVGSDNNSRSTEHGRPHTVAIERTEAPGYQRFLHQSSSR